jgi:hypothetical protein
MSVGYYKNGSGTVRRYVATPARRCPRIASMPQSMPAWTRTAERRPFSRKLKHGRVLGVRRVALRSLPSQVRCTDHGGHCLARRPALASDAVVKAVEPYPRTHTGANSGSRRSGARITGAILHFRCDHARQYCTARAAHGDLLKFRKEKKTEKKKKGKKIRELYAQVAHTAAFVYGVSRVMCV